MCGIAGIVDFSGPVEPERAIDMGRLLAHRGPDDLGSFHEQEVALAHRRLAILDLSHEGRQPMSDPTGRCWIVHNGEIYNYLELRAELEALGRPFRTRTDTEVIISSYLEWGTACVERFNGMWAFAIWDRQTKTLFCSRDRFGIKPFYYRPARDRISFASELKAFSAENIPLAANPRVVRDYLEHALLDHTEETFFAGIQQLPAAHSLIFDRNGLKLRRYWDLVLQETEQATASEAAEAVRTLFVDAVRLQLRSDVPIGSCLSGGLDSSAIVCTVDQLRRSQSQVTGPVGKRLRTFTAYFEGPGLDERRYAQAVVDRTGAEAHWVSFSDRYVMADLEAIVFAHDEPFRSTSMIAQWYVMRAASESGLKVMLDGQGADEILAGYRGFYPFLFADLLQSLRFRALLSELRGFGLRWNAGRPEQLASLVRPFVSEKLAWWARARFNGAASLVHPSIRTCRPELPAGDSPFPDRLRSRMHVVLMRRLPELLHAEDRNSMAHSLEARVPFLDHRLVQLVFSLGAQNLIEDGRSKIILRRALSDLLPSVVSDRSDKVGFATPERRWLHGPLGDLAQEVFHSAEFEERGFVNAVRAQRRLDAHRRGELTAGSELWRALNLELWARAFLGPRARLRTSLVHR